MSEITTALEALTIEEQGAFVRKFIKTKVLHSKEPYKLRYDVRDSKHITASFRKSANGKIYKVIIIWDTLADKWYWDTIF